MTVPRTGFELAVKSTIDRLCNDIVIAMLASGDPELSTLLAGCLDNLVEADEVKKSSNPAVMWEISKFEADPRDPLYTLHFSVGAKTMGDKDNYLATKLSSALFGKFFAGENFPVFDYSGASAPDTSGVNAGAIYVASASSSGMLLSDDAGLKLIDVEAKVIRSV